MKKVTLFLFAALIFSGATSDSIAQSKRSGTQRSTVNAVKSKGKIDKIESLRTKLAAYVADGKIFDVDEIMDYGGTSEFGRLYGTMAGSYDGNIMHYAGNGYCLMISYGKIDNNNKEGIKILDFVLFKEEKNQVLRHAEMCNVFRSGEPVCNEIILVVIRNIDIGTETPVIKAWKMDNKGKFIEANSTGLTWYESAP
ncbi:MAG: hypothetical protein LBR26_04885 [Prevotella sp.]|nr:hypothetical protein [Prevotella sp.]